MSKMSNRNFTFLVLGVVGLFFAALVAFNNQMFPWQRVQAVAENKEEQEGELEKERPMPAGRELRGGIPRPKTDMVDGTNRPAPDLPNITKKIGKVLPVAFDKNENTKSVADAAKTGKNLQRLSFMLMAKEFDLDEFNANPKAYLASIEPGRIRQTAPVNEATKPIKREGEYFQQMIQGETISLRARTDPSMPVTFYSPRLGSFSNSLSVITVQADETGLAEAQFTASRGAYGDLDLFAASPVRSHQVRYLVRIDVPESTAKIKEN